MLEAARQGNLASVKGLIEKGATLEAKTSYGQTPLYLAAMNGHLEVAQFLLDKGAQTEIRDTFYNAPMQAFVIMRKHYPVAKLLITKGTGPIDETLAAVVGTGNVELIQVVLDKGKPSQGALNKAL